MQKWFFVGIIIISVLVLFPDAALALSSPTSLSPSEEEVCAGNVKLSWDAVPGANSYIYEVDCSGSGMSCEGKGVIENQLTTYSRDQINLTELGEYQWRVKACTDMEGTSCGLFSPLQTFTLISGDVVGGFIPCGKMCDDPSSSYNESEACSIPHIFLLLKNLLEFAMWKLGLLIVAVMAVVTAVVSFFSFGSGSILTQIKASWRGILIGYLIMLSSWLLINILLGFFGFKIDWWSLPI